MSLTPSVQILRFTQDDKPIIHVILGFLFVTLLSAFVILSPSHVILVPSFVILSKAKNLSFFIPATSRSFVSLRMTNIVIHCLYLSPP